MKQLKFNFEKRNDDIPDFETWYSENSHERRTFGEKPYNRMKATSVYADLIESGFFKKEGK
jgi:hypothetical protein